jgi:heptaprenyl diphosphate synthase
MRLPADEFCPHHCFASHSGNSLTGKGKGTDVRHGVATLPVLLMRASKDTDARDLNTALSESAASDDPALFDKYVDELRASRFATETLDIARTWAKEAIDGLDALPDGLSKNALTRFASRVIERSS